MSPVLLRIAELRKVKGWSQNELATRSGVKQSTISRIENGTKSVDFGVLEKLANALDCHPSYLVVVRSD